MKKIAKKHFNEWKCSNSYLSINGLCLKTECHKMYTWEQMEREYCLNTGNSFKEKSNYSITICFYGGISQTMRCIEQILLLYNVKLVLWGFMVIKYILFPSFKNKCN